MVNTPQNHKFSFSERAMNEPLSEMLHCITEASGTSQPQCDIRTFMWHQANLSLFREINYYLPDAEIFREP